MREPNTKRIVSIAKSIEDTERLLAKLKNELRREIAGGISCTDSAEQCVSTGSTRARVLEVMTCCYPAPVHRPWLDHRLKDLSVNNVRQVLGWLLRSGKIEREGVASYRAAVEVGE